MGLQRKELWNDSFEAFSESQTEAILAACNVEVVSETSTHFLALCPWHGNDNTPALAVSKTDGVLNCFNPACGQAGGIRRLISYKHPEYNPFQIERLIIKSKTSSVSIEDRLKKALERPVEYPAFPQEQLDKMKRDFKGSIAEEYMHSRGFEDETLDYFDVGYSGKQNMVIVPAHDPMGNPIGLIGRSPSHEDKRFKNSNGLPKSKTAWNFHRAKKHDTVIITEASYDSMRIHQAGFPGTIALLGGSLSAWHIDQIGKAFSNIIIFTDNDKRQHAKPNCTACKHLPPDEYGIRCIGHKPGRDLGRQIANAFPTKRVSWAVYDGKNIYPHDAKDASDLTDHEIYQCITNAIPNIEYISLALDQQDLFVV